MPTSKEMHDYILECLRRAGNVSTRRMMGEYCVYCEGKLVGQMYEGSLYLKETETTRSLLSGCPLEHPHGTKAAYYRADCFEDVQQMGEVLRGMIKELPEPAPKKGRGKK